MSIAELMRANLRELQAYQPQENPGLRLHTNELPWTALRFGQIAMNEYPAQGYEYQLKKELSTLYAVSEEELLITRGSDEGIELIFKLFLEPFKDSLLLCPPTFSMYAFYAQLQPVEIINSPLNPNNFKVDFKKLTQLWQPNCKLIMLCNPNNPTGTTIAQEEIQRLCSLYEKKAIIVVDEAYIEFANIPSASHLLKNHTNLIILRTLSKAYGLAGLRLGAILASKEIIQALTSIRAPFAISNVVTNLALKALAKKNWYSQTLDKILAYRETLYENLQNLACIEAVTPSQANFLWIKIANASQIANLFAKNHLLVRTFNAPFENYLRISIGTKNANTKVLKLLKAVRTT